MGLAPDVILVSDGGGFTGAPRKPIRGIVYVARAIVVLSRRRPAGSDAADHLDVHYTLATR